LADRAGVSVGTLYQYFPNKQSLLFAVLEDHLERVTAAENACEHARHKPLTEMIKEVVEAFVDATIARADISVALYKVAPDLGGLALLKRVTQRLRKAIARMLESAPDTRTSLDEFAIQMMLAAMSGAMRSVLETGGSPVMMRKMREQMVGHVFRIENYLIKCFYIRCSGVGHQITSSCIAESTASMLRALKQS
jgi:AcrR family transcriptional regulator